MSEYENRGSRVGLPAEARSAKVGGRLDTAIDRAVREMLDVEPPPGLRGRVLDGIESPRRGFGWLWVAGPLAAAAILILAVLLPWRSGTATRPEPRGNGADQRLALETSPRSPTSAPSTPAIANSVPSGPVQIANRRTEPPRPGLIQAAETTNLAEDVNFTAIEALAGPASIAVESLTGPPAPSLRSIEPPPLQIRALEVIGLPETPRERREE
jgi:hypothetical protein